ncbi:MAG: hypothetical protein K5905_20870 [Roseibium sp.]|uniref:hypothetical protein n=1 Tax=Roseibium sp. TaxID=1936156 RepID=UPI002605AD54|nr:hypothetical protein [Roseibium sp.]MCV0427918.1 hypothetical protein [Roseibium sp.]
MYSSAIKQSQATDPVVNIMLTGGRVTLSFREAAFSAAARTNTSVNELVLTALAEKLAGEGYRFGGVFKRGDFTSLGLTPSADVLEYRGK